VARIGGGGEAENASKVMATTTTPVGKRLPVRNGKITVRQISRRWAGDRWWRKLVQDLAQWRVSILAVSNIQDLLQGC
jgi:hypothetical protein